MKLLLIGLLSVSGGVASGIHFHSFILGLSVASLAVGSCYWFAFRSNKTPHLAFVLLGLGMFAKLAVTIAGVSWGLSKNLITSPLVFSLSYLFFSIVVTYCWFTYRDRGMALTQWILRRFS